MLVVGLVVISVTVGITIVRSNCIVTSLATVTWQRVRLTVVRSVPMKSKAKRTKVETVVVARVEVTLHHLGRIQQYSQ